MNIEEIPSAAESTHISNLLEIENQFPLLGTLAHRHFFLVDLHDHITVKGSAFSDDIPIDDRQTIAGSRCP